MKFSQFKIGKKFWMSGKQYLCTDIGTRTIIATHFNPGKLKQVIRSERINGRRTEKHILEKVKRRWFKPPYYIVGEDVILACEYEACQATCTQFQRELAAEWVRHDRASNRRWLRSKPRRQRLERRARPLRGGSTRSSTSIE